MAMAGFELTVRERQLLRLALCGSAQGGEVTTSAEKLIQSLRNRGVESSVIESALEGNGADELSVPFSKPDYGLNTMPWGVHKGEAFMNIPPQYLHWVLDVWMEKDNRAVAWNDLKTSIEEFLKQGS